MKSIGVVGSGTAGLVTSLLIKKAFPNIHIEIISSSNVGIIGVGEGSTEHWRIFMEACELPVVEVLNRTMATHKNGIRFENWTNHTPDYIHSVSRAERYGYFQPYSLYNGLIAQEKTLTENIASRALIENKVPRDGTHLTVNQFHFDTFKLNEYLKDVCLNRGIFFTEGDVSGITKDLENGYIKSVFLEDGRSIYHDFWIDASGFKKVLISKMSEGNNWNSFSDYLQMDSAIAFPTESDPSGQIRPYTRARAMKYGWVWEIPTQERRGNGYVFSSKYINEDQAVEQASELIGEKIESVRSFKFDPGHLKEMWIKNCVAVGLSSSFVEPLEATSIGSSIQQARCLIQNLTAFNKNSVSVQKIFNRNMNAMMENMLAFIFLHYISDRTDSEMWIEQQNIKAPEYLQNLLDLWSERPPFYEDVHLYGFEMFHVPHFYHVGQGQKIFKRENAQRMLDIMDLNHIANIEVNEAKQHQHDHVRIDHREALREIQI